MENLMFNGEEKNKKEKSTNENHTIRLPKRPHVHKNGSPFIVWGPEDGSLQANANWEWRYIYLKEKKKEKLGLEQIRSCPRRIVGIGKDGRILGNTFWKTGSMFLKRVRHGALH